MLLTIFVVVVWNSPNQGIIPTRVLASFNPVIAYKNHHSKSTHLRPPSLYEEEMESGFRLGTDSWADTGCSGENAYVDEFVEGNCVNVTGITPTLVSIDNLPIAHLLYVFDKEYVTVVLFEHNHTIYMGDNMIDSLCNPIQYEDNDVIVDLSPKVYYSNNDNSNLITFLGGNSIPVE